jgi:ribosomal protein S18 acetylase RimI-like enzyme
MDEPTPKEAKATEEPPLNLAAAIRATVAKFGGGFDLDLPPREATRQRFVFDWLYTSDMVRRANLADIPALAALHVRSWRETYAGILPSEMLANLSVETRAAMWRKIVGTPADAYNATVHVAEDEEQIVGFGCCGQQRDPALAEAGFSGEFSAIYIARTHQGLGIGRLLMRSMADALLSAGLPAASLWVVRDNAAACGFYERLGGSIVGETEVQRSDATLFELAYGWRDLSLLLA